MKKVFISSLMMSFVFVACYAQHPRITQLIAEKQAKMEKLEKCQGTTKSLKIAGISTLGITAVGVGANIAEAVVLNKTKDEVKKATEARDEQKKIKEAREAEEKKRQEEERQRLEEERKQQECQSKHKKYVNGACGECEEGYISKDGNCVEKPKPDESKKQGDGDKQEDKKPDDQNNKKSGGNENAELGTPDNDKPSTPVEQVNAFSKACTSARYTLKDIKDNNGKVIEHSCFVYKDGSGNSDTDYEQSKTIFRQFKTSNSDICKNVQIYKSDDYHHAANCGKGTDDVDNRFYVVFKKKATSDDATNNLKRFEKACRDAGFPPTQGTTNSGKDYIACIIGGDKNRDAKPADMEATLNAAAKQQQFADKGCANTITKLGSFWLIECANDNDIRYNYKNLICEDDEEEKGGECIKLNCDASEHKFAKNHKCEECKTTEALKNGKCEPLVCINAAKGYLYAMGHVCNLQKQTWTINDFEHDRVESVKAAKEKIKKWLDENVKENIADYKCTVTDATILYRNKDTVECVYKTDNKLIFKFIFQDIDDADDNQVISE